ncbi:MFS transporter [Embleya sp. NPDC005971]|uniref:MFS transporter n=1 Tax=unclassified Embleya TaxID=2699296 RepID=UPI0033EE6763
MSRALNHRATGKRGTASPPETSPGTGRVAAVVGFLVVVELLSGVVQSMIPPLLPRLGTDLHIGTGDLNWIGAVQLVAATVCVPLFARLGDLYGHRLLLRVAMVCVVAGSVLVAWAPSFEVLLLGRVLQGPLAALLPLEIGLVRGRLTAEGARKSVGMLVGALTCGTGIGFVASGLLGEALSNVHAILWVPAIATIVCAALTFVLVPDTDTRAPGGVDWAGAALLSGGLAALMLGFSRGADHGWNQPDTLALFTASAILLAAWVMVELRVEHPVVDIRTATRRSLWPVYTAALILGVTLYASKTAAALFLAAPPKKLGYGFGYDTLTIGWMLLPAALCAFLGSALAPRIARAIGSRAVLVVGSASIASGFVFLALAHGEPWQFIVADVALGLGLGLGLSMLPVLVLDSSAADRTGVDTGIYSTAKTLGGSLSGAVFAAVLTSMTVKGGRFPSETAYETVWWISAGVSLLIAATAAVLTTTPRPHPGTAAPTPAARA